MDTERSAVAMACLEAAQQGRMAFPQIVGALSEAGFESYAIDFRRAVATYYLPDGTSIELPTHRTAASVAATLDLSALRAAIGDAQRQVPGYTYAGFCEKAVSAGCAGYIVSFIGRRAVYFGRTAETHVEYFLE
jgi:uncharacterized protein YbcV (DUF1398 family)